jgi:hypothetical protein
MEPNSGAIEITLRDSRDWSRALRLDLAFGGELAKVHPPAKASINCKLLVICCTRSKETAGQFASEIA